MEQNRNTFLELAGWFPPPPIIFLYIADKKVLFLNQKRKKGFSLCKDCPVLGFWKLHKASLSQTQIEQPAQPIYLQELS